MTRRIVISFVILLTGLMAQNVFAKVSGLPDFTELVEETGPAVVNIRVTQFGNRARGDQDDDQAYDHEEVPEFFRRFFDVPGNPGYGQPDRQGAGSGFIIESDGYVITNHHVIDGADEIIVRMADRREFEAELIGSDEQSDIALLKIDAKNLPTLKLGDSQVLQRGEWVVAIGSPFNYDQSVTAGIVSAKGRSNGAQQYVPFIQTDVAINRGNSGGPLINMDGEVVGVNSWILSSSGGYIGLSFSIPIETARNTVEQLREFGHVSRGLLGVVVGAVTRELAEAMNLDRTAGALINDVNPGGAAEKAGIQPGDIILEFDGQTIEAWGDLPPMVGANPPGTEANVLVSRNGKEMSFKVTLDALEIGPDGNLQASSSESEQSNALGLEVEEITAEQRSALGDPDGGVLITDVQSDSAYRAGLRRGDVILMINNLKVEDLASFTEMAKDLSMDKAVALRVWRQGTAAFIAYTPSGE